MKGRVEFEGFDEIIREFSAAPGKARGPLFGALRDGAPRVVNRAKRGIAKGPKTGKIYTTRFATGRNGNVFAYGSRPPHQASAPGEYPAGDTGRLMGSIHDPVQHDQTPTRLVIDIDVNAAHAAPLEFKPAEKGGRPFLSRAAEEEAPAIFADAEARLKAAGA
jgi:hypothetical protein